MVKIFCKLCLQSIPGAEWKSHIAQKLHLQQLPCKIVVKGSFNQDEIDLAYEYFGNFGGIRGQEVTVNGNETSIEYRFWDARVYSDVIHQEHLLFDHDIEISWFKKVKLGPLLHVVPDERMHKEKFVYRKLSILNALKELPTFDEQLTLLQNKLKITKTSLESNRRTIQDDLSAVLATNFPRSKIHFFGSIITDLNIHDSDLNMYLNNTDSELTTLEFIKDLITKSEFFTRISLNPESETIKCQHKKSQIACELSIVSELPVGNSELIKFYLTLDEKLRPLMVVIKFWADCCDLRHENGFSSYAIYLMVLFYLQQDPYSLPSVVDLQKDVPPDEIDGWNCAFGPIEFISSSLERATIFELLMGFFKFYGNFDYMSKVISPYYGSMIEKVCFLQPYDLPECFENFLNQEKTFVLNSGICIQDVFKHSKNVSLSVDLSSMGRFAAICRNSFELLRSDTKDVLYKLLLAPDETLNEFSLENELYDEQKWIFAIKTLVLKILREICSCEVEEKSDDSTVLYNCRGSSNVWDNRVDVLKNLITQFSLDVSSITSIDREVAVTSHIIKSSSQDAIWKMVVSLKFDSEPCRVSVSFIEDENVPLILHIKHFVYVKLVGALNDLHMDNSNLEVSTTQESSTEDKFPVEKIENSWIKGEELVVADEKQELVKSEQPCAAIPLSDVKLPAEQSQLVEEDSSLVDTGTSTSYNVTVSVAIQGKQDLEEKNTEENSCAIDAKTPEDRRDVENLVVNVAVEETCDFNTINQIFEETQDRTDEIVEDKVGDFEGIQNARDRNQIETVSSESDIVSVENEKNELRVDESVEKTQTPSDRNEEECLSEVPNTLVLVNADGSKLVDNLTVVVDLASARQQDPIVEKGQVVTNLIEREAFGDNETVTGDIEAQLQDKSVGETQLVRDLTGKESLATIVNVEQITSSIEMAVDSIEAERQDQVVENAIIVTDSSEAVNLASSSNVNVIVSTDIVTLRVGIEVEPQQSVEGIPLTTNLTDTENIASGDIEMASVDTEAKQDQENLASTGNIDEIVPSGSETVNTDIEVKAEQDDDSVEDTELTVDLKEIKSEDIEMISVDVDTKPPEDETKHLINLDNVGKIVSDLTSVKDEEKPLIGQAKNSCSVKIEEFQDVKDFNGAENLINVYKIDKTLSDDIEASAETIETQNEGQVSKESSFSADTEDSQLVVDLNGTENSVTSSPIAKVVTNSNSEDKEINIEERVINDRTTIRKPTVNENLSVEVIQNSVTSTRVPSSSKTKFKKNVAHADLEATTSASDFKIFKKTLANAVKPIPTFEDQVTVFLNYVQVDTVQIKRNLLLIHDDLTTTLSSNFPHHKIHFYGPVVTGLVIHDDQLEIYLSNVLKNLTLKQTLDAVKNQIIHRRKFHEVVHANGVVTFIHLKTKIKCKLNLLDVIGVKNSELMQYYVGLDDKIHTVVLVISCWAMCNNFYKFTRQAIYMLVIFYLQQEPYNLPSVVELQKNTTPEMHDGWNCAFTRLEYKSTAFKSATVYDLLKGFFEFYEQFDYIDHVVAPYFGSPIEKIRFIKPFDLPEAYQNYINKDGWQLPVLPGMCIQDPFDHSNNISREAIVTRGPGRFTIVCRASLELFSYSEEELLYNMFIGGQESQLRSFCIHKDNDENVAEWSRFIKRLILVTFGEVLACRFVEEPESCNMSELMIDTKIPVLERRTLALKDMAEFSPDMSEIEKEIALASYVAKNLRSDKCNWKTFVQVVLIPDPWRIRVELRGRNCCSVRMHLDHFLRIKLVKFLQEREKTEKFLNGRFPEKRVSSETVDGQDSANSSPALPADILEKLKNCATFSDQTTILYDSLNNDRAQVEKHFEIISQDLALIVSKKFPNSTIQPYGSRTLNLDLPDSNYDFYIDSGVSILTYVQQELNDLLKNSDKFHKASISEDLIKCVHLETQASCILNIKNKVWLKTTELNKYYCSLDNKIPMLLKLVKFWMQQLDLTRENGFTTCSLHLMVIFYLQQEPYKLPSINKLLKNEDSDYELQPSDFNNSTLKSHGIFELVWGFFKFYSTFPYLSDVVSPFCGVAIDKCSFLQPYTLPQCYRQYILKGNELSVNSGLCIQDPFEHTNNVSVALSREKAGQFTAMCRTAVQVLSDNLIPLFSLHPDKVFGTCQIIKSTNQADKTWRNFIETNTSEILRKILGCTIIESFVDPTQTTYLVYQPVNIWDNRTYILKNLPADKSGDSSATEHILKEEAPITSSMGEVKLNFSKNPCRVDFVVKRAHDKSHFVHVLYTKLLFFLGKHSNSVDISAPAASVNVPLPASRDTSAKKSEEFVTLKNLLMTELTDVPTFTEQISILFKTLQPDRTTHESKCAQACTDLITLMGTATKRVEIFGSAASKLNTHHSPVDFFIDLKAHRRDDKAQLDDIATRLVSSKTFSNVRFDYSNCHLVLKCTHLYTQLDCVIDVRLKYAPMNVILVNYYANLDEKVHQLMFFLKLWAGGCAAYHLRPHILYLLVIFFLQHEPYKVPPVADILDQIWNESWKRLILKPLEFKSGVLERATIFELVVAPLSGVPTSKKELELVNPWLTVQHPLQKNKNITFMSDHLMSAMFAHGCRQSLSMMEHGQNNLLAMLLRGEHMENPTFELTNVRGIAHESWKKIMIETFQKIATELLNFTFQKVNDAGFFIGVCRVEIYQQAVAQFKSHLQRILSNGSDWDKDKDLFSTILDPALLREMDVQVTFDSCPSKMIFTLAKPNDLMFHYLHIFYTRMMKFGPQEVDVFDKWSFLNSLDDGTTFADQVAILEKNLNVHKDRTQKLHTLISEDLTSALLPTFPNIKFDFCGSITECNWTKLSFIQVCVEGVDVQDFTVDLIEDLISVSNKFTNVSLLENSENSIRGEHVNTQTVFELNVKNKLLLRTSELIRWCMSLDNRISSLLTITKFWTDWVQNKFTHNCVSLMTIFYLQVVYKLPAVAEMKEDFQQGVECVDLKDVTLFDLVVGFFKFYNQFDYNSYVISPYFGSLIEKTRLLKPLDLPDTFQHYLDQNIELSVTTYLDIQDPFQLYKNVTAHLSEVDVAIFIGRCRLTLRTLKNDSPSLSMMIKYQEEDFREVIYTIERKADQDPQKWLEAVRVVLVKLLKYVMASTETFVALKPSEGELWSWDCKGRCNVWQHRAHVAKRLLLPEGISNVDREIAITKGVNAQFYQFLRPWKLMVAVTLEEGSSAVIFSVKRGPSVFWRNCRGQFLYVELLKALSGDIDEIVKNRNISQGATDLCAVLVNTKFNSATSFTKQAKVIRHKLMVNEGDTELKQLQGLIENDLNSALSSLPLKKMYFNFRLFTCEPLNIYIEIEDNHSNSISVENLKELIHNGGDFSNIFLISKSIIRCTHTQSKTVCELNSHDKLSEERSKLIKYYIYLDKQVTLLMCYLKFWADENKLTDMYGFSNNAIYIMVIFFLQQHYQFPSVKQLQDNEPPNEIDGWNCAFKPHEFTSPTLRSKSIQDLSIQFFRFYGNFDYVSQVIAPFLGQVVRKVLFLQPHELPESYDCYKKQTKLLTTDSSICIQDFFDHSKNVSSAYLYVCGRFATLCRFSIQMLKQHQTNFMYGSMVDYRSFFTILVDRTNMQSMKQFMEQVIRKLFACSMSLIHDDEFFVKYECTVMYDVWSDRITCLKNVKKVSDKAVWSDKLTCLKNVPEVSDKIQKESCVTSGVIAEFPKRCWAKFIFMIFNGPESTEIQFLRITDFPLFFHMCNYLYVEFFQHRTQSNRNVMRRVSEMSVLENSSTSQDNPSQHEVSMMVENKSYENSAQYSNNTTIGNTNAYISPSTSTFAEPNLNTPEVVEDLITSLNRNNPSTFKEQVSFLYTNFISDKTTLDQNLKTISDDLLSTLKYHRHRFYGSAVQGLHTRLSDVNIQIYDRQPMEIKTLLSTSAKFKNITTTRENDIKCFHPSTKLRLTITTKGEIAVNTSQLISYYLSLDEKLPPLVATIKYWAHNESHNHFTGYTLTLMVIFYLQGEYKLPSVVDLQKNRSPILVDNWDCVFNTNVITNLLLKNATIFDLVKGFFKFYGDFDHFLFVVTPFYGTPAAKTRFLQPFSLPEGYRLYVNRREELVVDAGMCVQDPFEHTKNITVSVCYSAACMFAIRCRNAVGRMHLGEERMLEDLLTHREEALQARFSLLKPEKLSNVEWVESIKNLVRKIVTRVLAGSIIQVVNIGRDSSAYKCQGPHSVRDNRIKTWKNVLKELRNTVSPIDKEIAVTSRIIQNSKKSDQRNWKLHVQMTREDNPCRVRIAFTGTTATYFCHFIYTKLLKFLNNDDSSSSIKLYYPSDGRTVRSDDVEKLTTKRVLESKVRTTSAPLKRKFEHSPSDIATTRKRGRSRRRYKQSVVSPVKTIGNSSQSTHLEIVSANKTAYTSSSLSAAVCNLEDISSESSTQKPKDASSSPLAGHHSLQSVSSKSSNERNCSARLNTTSTNEEIFVVSSAEEDMNQAVKGKDKRVSTEDITSKSSSERVASSEVIVESVPIQSTTTKECVKVVSPVSSVSEERTKISHGTGREESGSVSNEAKFSKDIEGHLPATDIQHAKQADVQVSTASTVSTTVNEQASATSSTSSNVSSSNQNADYKKLKQSVLKKTKDILAFDAQTSYFCSKLVVDKKIVDTNQTIVEHDLKLALALKHNVCTIFFFGSSVIGLFSEDSTFDIFIENLEPRPGVTGLKFHLVQDCLVGSGKFHEIVSSLADQVVRCRHKETKIECEIRMNTRLPVCNSRLIYYYLSLDPKLRQLVFLIKSWAESNQLKKVSFFSNYSLYLMILFYLQQDPYKLPSVSELQNNAPADFIGDWNGGFIPIKFNSPALKSATIKDLLFGFFRFYSTFDFFSYVIAPYFGSIINKVCFLKPFDLPACYETFLKGNHLMFMEFGAWVQDPFEHSKNVTGNVNLISMGRFTALCRTALQLIPPNDKQLLYRLMLQCQNGSMVDYRGIEIEKGEMWDELHWIQVVRNVLFVIVTNILCCNILQVQQKRLNEGNRKIYIANKQRTGEVDQIVINCLGMRNIWEGRINILKLWQNQIPHGSTCFDVDLFVSNFIMNDLRRVATFDLCLEMTFIRNPTSVRVAVYGANKLHFTHFFYTRMLKALEAAELKEQICNQFSVDSPALPLNAVSEPYKILVKGKFQCEKILEVHDSFSNFGKIVGVNILGEDTNLAIEYCFSDRDVYLRVIQEEHFIFDQKVKLIPLAPLKAPIPNAKFKDRRLALIHSVVESSTFEHQVETLWSALNSDKLEIEEKHETIRNDFSCALLSRFANVRIYSGSNIAGLNIENDHLDVYVESVATKNEVATLQTMKDVICSKNSFCGISLASRTSDPHIICTHVKSKVTCYLRVRNKLSVNRNQLIRYYLSLDSKLPKFMLLLKFWADCYDLIDVEAFSESAIYLMIVFYLQQQYKLPAVKDLQDNITPEYVNSWNCAYAEILDFTSPALKAATVLDLVAGFFRFFANFDYVTYVISPYYGSPLEKVRFLKPYVVPKCFKQFSNQSKDLNLTSSICIQDFFEHCRNVSSSVTQDCVGRFTSLCRSSLHILDSEEDLTVYKLLINAQPAIFEYPGFVIEKTNDRDEQEWGQEVKSLTLKILSDVLNYKLSTISAFGVEKTSFGCVGQHNVWGRRVRAMKTLSGQKTLRGIDKEVAITTQVIIDFREKVTWNLFLDLTFMKNPSRAKVVFLRKPGCLHVYHVCHFLYTRLVKFLDGGRTGECLDIVEVESTTPRKPTSDSTKKHQRKTSKGSNPPPETAQTIQVESDFTKALPEETQTNDKESPPCKRKRSKLVEEGEITDEEEEDDDVPSDFFDDFAKEDFLDGLDIVDAWENDSKEQTKEVSENAPSVSRQKKRSRSKSRSRRKRRKRSKSRQHSTSRSRSRSRSRSSDRKRRDRVKRSRRSSSASSRGKDRKYRGRSRSRSRSRTKSRSRTPSSRRSKRSRWSPAYRSRRRSTSRDSKTSSSRSISRINETQRKSFLEEIRDKLNEVRPVAPPPPIIYNLASYSNAVQPVPTPPISHPVCASYFAQPPPPGVQSYDHRFFVGGSVPEVRTPTPPPEPVPRPLSLETSQNKKEEKPSKVDYAKLFAEKKISLSDYLAITAKQEASVKSADAKHLQEKAQVLTRCQDIIKLLHHDRRLTGRLTVTPTPKPPTTPHQKYQSPLKKMPVVRFRFTSPPKNSSSDIYGAALDKILEKVGVTKKVEKIDGEDIVDIVTEALVKSAAIDKETVTRILRETLLGVVDSGGRTAVGMQSASAVNSNSVGFQAGEGSRGSRGYWKRL